MAVERAKPAQTPRTVAAQEEAARVSARPLLRLFDVAEYYRMAEVGILHPEERLELIEGRIVHRSTPRPRLFDVDEYYAMADAGILRPDERVELIDGEIRVMSPVGRRHIASIIRLNRVFAGSLLPVAEVSIQSPVRLANRVEPEPDVAILRLQPTVVRPYESAHPRPEDVLLIVEIAETSLAYDLGEKADLYARYGVPELWVLDLPGDRVVIHREPTPDGYASVVELPRDGSVSPLAFPDVAFSADDLLGPPVSAEDVGDGNPSARPADD